MSDLADTTSDFSVSDADLMAAVTDAFHGASSGAEEAPPAADAGADEAEAAPDEKAPQKAAQAADDDIDPRAVLRARMEKARAAKAAKAESRRQAELAEKLREYEQARPQAASSFDLDGFKSKFYQSPLSALQELGVDLDTFTQRVLEENTPQSQLAQQLKAVQERIESFEKQKKEAEEREAKLAEERQRHQEEQEFCSMITTEDYPSLYEWFSDDPHALIREAEVVATDLLKAGHDPDDIEDADIADFLEMKYAKKLQKLKGVSAARKATQPASGASKPRSPSQASASETKLGGPKNFWDLSADEQDALLNEVARTATAN